jgi:hypothetical protein
MFGLTWTRGIYLLAAMSGIIYWKMMKVDNVEAKQAVYENTLMIFGNRMSGYDKDLEDVRVSSRVSEKMLESIQKDTREIKQLMLNKK